eukprot:6333580-Ditylum_brightwellii.AAC.1
MVLNASTEDCINPATTITPEFKLIIEQPSLSAQHNMLNHMLQTMGCMVDIPTALAAFLISGDWIVRNSNKPGKVTIMLLGRVGKSSNSKEAMEERVRMLIKQSEGN